MKYKGLVELLAFLFCLLLVLLAISVYLTSNYESTLSQCLELGYPGSVVENGISYCTNALEAVPLEDLK